MYFHKIETILSFQNIQIGFSKKYLNVKFLLMIFNVKQIVQSTDDNGKSNLFVILKSVWYFDNPENFSRFYFGQQFSI